MTLEPPIDDSGDGVTTTTGGRIASSGADLPREVSPLDGQSFAVRDSVGRLSAFTDWTRPVHIQGLHGGAQA